MTVKKPVLNPKRFTAYKRSVQTMYQWDAVHGLTFEQAHAYEGKSTPDKDGYHTDSVRGKYKWVPCLTECYRGNGN